MRQGEYTTGVKAVCQPANEELQMFMRRKRRSLLFRGVIGKHDFRLSRRHINVLSRLDVSELLASFFFDGRSIVFNACTCAEYRSLSCCTCTICLRSDWNSARFCLYTTIPLAPNITCRKSDPANNDRDRSNGAGAKVKAIGQRTDSFDPRCSKCFSLRRTLRHCTKPVFRPRKTGNSGQSSLFIQISSASPRYSVSANLARCALRCKRAQQAPFQIAGSRPMIRR